MTGMVPTVYVVDDDLSVLRAVERLLRSANYNASVFSSAQDFLDLQSYEYPSCLILDVTMPGLSGLDVQDKIVSDGNDIPIIFLTGYGTIPMTVNTLKKGAVNFLEKPVDQSELLSEVGKAIELNISQASLNLEISSIKVCISKLTPREKEVFELVVQGYLNKQIADQLNICEKTVKVHRARVMEKMEAKSLAELVHANEVILSHLKYSRVQPYRN